MFLTNLCVQDVLAAVLLVEGLLKLALRGCYEQVVVFTVTK